VNTPINKKNAAGGAKRGSIPKTRAKKEKYYRKILQTAMAHVILDWRGCKGVLPISVELASLSFRDGAYKTLITAAS
jgi:hypothetical protein